MQDARRRLLLLLQLQPLGTAHKAAQARRDPPQPGQDPRDHISSSHASCDRPGCEHRRMGRTKFHSRRDLARPAQGTSFRRRLRAQGLATTRHTYTSQSHPETRVHTLNRSRAAVTAFWPVSRAARNRICQAALSLSEHLPVRSGKYTESWEMHIGSHCVALRALVNFSIEM